jgi:transcriptional regulator with XRE-family HTH domain
MDFGTKISKLRKEQNMTQQDLAEKLNITDKAVSKWERNLSYPDITSISKLAEELKVDSKELIELCKKDNPYNKKEDINKLIDFILVVIPFGLSIALIVLSIISEMSTNDKIGLISVAIFSISIYNLRKLHNKNT